MVVTFSIMNDILAAKIERIGDLNVTYDDYYSLFNILRGALGIVLSPILGSISELSGKLFSSRNFSLKKLILPLFLAGISNIMYIFDGFKEVLYMSREVA